MAVFLNDRTSLTDSYCRCRCVELVERKTLSGSQRSCVNIRPGVRWSYVNWRSWTFSWRSSRNHATDSERISLKPNDSWRKVSSCLWYLCVCVCVRACVRVYMFNNGQVLCIFIFVPLVRPSCWPCTRYKCLSCVVLYFVIKHRHAYMCTVCGKLFDWWWWPQSKGMFCQSFVLVQGRISKLLPCYLDWRYDDVIRFEMLF